MLQRICNRQKYFSSVLFLSDVHIECNEDVELHEKLNYMSLKFADARYLKTVLKHLSKTNPGTILRSNQITGIEVRMLPPFIKDNKTRAIWPFPGHAQLYCLTIVLSDVANQLAGNIELNTFPSVGDNEYLQINKTIFYWEEASQTVTPGQVHLMSTIIKSKDGLRNTADVLALAKDDDGYKDIINRLLAIYTTGSVFPLLTELSFQIAGVIGSYLGEVHDTPLGTVVNSFTRLHGDWDILGVTPVVINTKYVDFHFELIVRDNSI